MKTLKINISALATLLMTSIFISHVAAAPGTLATQPLQTAASAESNVMFALDSSGSMRIISPEPFTHTFTCDETNALVDQAKEIELDIDANEPEIKYEGDADNTSRPLGNTSDSTTYCFDPTKFYTARLNTNTGGGAGGWGFVEYKGDYLNWYFDSSNDGTTNWSQYKPTARTRMAVAQTALNGLIDTLKSVNVGLASFDSSSNGGDLDVNVAMITSSHATTLKTAVTNTLADGGTPLSETLRDIGRYFASGSTNTQCGGAANTDLTIHPDDALVAAGGLKEDIDCETLLEHSDYTSDFDDDFGPIKYFCQKNFAIMLTDGFASSDSSIHSDLRDYDQDCPDPADPDTYTCSSDVRSDDPGPSTGYWDDVAQALYEIDLRPDLNNQQGNFHKNNLVTYTVGFADKNIKDLQLIKDAAKQGGGESYYAANSADLTQILTDINAQIEGLSGTAAAVTFNSSTLSSQSAVYQALFNTQRWSGQLRSIPLDGISGNVLSNCTEGTSNCWYAEKMLDAQTTRTILTYNPVSLRGVDFAYNASSVDYTTITSSDTTSEIIPKSLIDDFCASHDIPYPCNASTTADSTKLAANKAYMSDLVDYLRGDRTHESTTSSRDFRIRGHKLGDIVNSSPVYVGKPSLGWPNYAPFPDSSSSPDNSYYTWANSAVKNRMPVVYVAANDGMLHGFRTIETDPGASSADAGEEVLAFIPSAVAGSTNNSGLHYLADPTYQHRFYLDLNPAISDVYIKHRDTTVGGVTPTKEWRTVLVGGQGAGGNTMYMLDVTEPGIPSVAGSNHFSASYAKELVEWEFSQPNLGYTYSKPTIAMMNNGRFAAIFGNGYNSSEFGGDCKAKLFVVFLDGGVDGSWNLGTDPSDVATDYMIFDTNNDGDSSDCNGLSTPAVVDLNGDSVADKVYAGDMYGNLWAFDLCNESSSACQTTGWALANTSPIMTATNNSSQRQPITVKPIISQDPSSTGLDDLIIAFGTGQYLASGDITTTEVQSFYAVRHYSARTNCTNSCYGLDPRAGSTKFAEQVITEQACTAAGCSGDVRVVTDNPMINNGTGWYIDFDFNDNASPPVSVAGERMVVNPKVRNDTLFFNTVIPDDRKCYAGGNGWLMSLNLANGGRPLQPVFDLNLDGSFDSDDQEGGTNPAGQKVFAIPAESTFLGDNQYTPDSEGNIAKRKVNIKKDEREGRMSWKEVFEDH